MRKASSEEIVFPERTAPDQMLSRELALSAMLTICLRDRTEVTLPTSIRSALRSAE